MGKDYYKILGVSKNVNDADLKKAYKQQAMKFHPDKHKEEAAKKKAEEKFKDIAEAYDVLSDKQKRETYDRFGEEGLKAGGGGGAGGAAYRGVDPTEVFSRFFSSSSDMGGVHMSFISSDPDEMFAGMPGMSMGGPFSAPSGISRGMRSGIPGQQQRRRPSQPKIYQIELLCTLEELYIGNTRKMKVGRKRFNSAGQYTNTHTQTHTHTNRSAVSRREGARDCCNTGMERWNKNNIQW
eukprot:GHVR01049922.1.p1 GENE.GHVR01049922.1~~GHVR01049922.1.p1  ORF type:complete len:238 (+),score=55.76 GHVR01049922.1:105-818(+)